MDTNQLPPPPITSDAEAQRYHQARWYDERRRAEDTLQQLRLTALGAGAPAHVLAQLEAVTLALYRVTPLGEWDAEPTTPAT